MLILYKYFFLFVKLKQVLPDNCSFPRCHFVSVEKNWTTFWFQPIVKKTVVASRASQYLGDVLFIRCNGFDIGCSGWLLFPSGSQYRRVAIAGEVYQLYASVSVRKMVKRGQNICSSYRVNDKEHVHIRNNHIHARNMYFIHSYTEWPRSNWR